MSPAQYTCKSPGSSDLFIACTYRLSLSTSKMTEGGRLCQHIQPMESSSQKWKSIIVYSCNLPAVYACQKQRIRQLPIDHSYRRTSRQLRLDMILSELEIW
jgi:hypothetical protein